MFAAPAATFPPAIATSRTALTFFRGSMPWPPFSKRAYFGWADTPAAPAMTRQMTVRFTSPSTVGVAPCRPLRRQVLAHVERARHAVARDRAGELEAQC